MSETSFSPLMDYYVSGNQWDHYTNRAGSGFYNVWSGLFSGVFGPTIKSSL